MSTQNSQGIDARLRTFTVFFWGFLIASAAIASEEHRAEVRIAVEGHDNGVSEFRFDSGDAGVDLYELDVGESKSYTDNDGNEVTVTRNKNGFEFEVAGDTFVVADVMHDEHGLNTLYVAHEDENLVVEKRHKVHVVETDHDVGVTVISGDRIDAETRVRIEQVLKEAGKDGETVFIDGSELSGDERAERKHEVRIVKKEINVTN